MTAEMITLTTLKLTLIVAGCLMAGGWVGLLFGWALCALFSANRENKLVVIPARETGRGDECQKVRQDRAILPADDSFLFQTGWPFDESEPERPISRERS